MPYRTKKGIVPRVTEVVATTHCKARGWIPTNMPADRDQVYHYGQILGKIVHHNIAVELGKMVRQPQQPIRWTRTERMVLQRELSKGKAKERLDRDVATCMEAYRMFWADYKIEPIWVERRVFSEVKGYAGTLDLMGLVQLRGSIARDQSMRFMPNHTLDPIPTVTIIDWKTSREPSRDYQLQGTAYWEAADEMGLFTPFRRKKYAINYQTWAVLLGAGRFRMKKGYNLAASDLDSRGWLEAFDFFREAVSEEVPTTENQSGIDSYHLSCMICSDIPNCPDRGIGPGAPHPTVELQD